MSWQRNLREGLAALGVVAGLLFVGYETRQNTAALRSQTLLGTADMVRDQTNQLLHSPELLAAYTLAILNDSPESLTEDQAWLLAVWVTGAMRITQNRFRQVSLGALEGGFEVGADYVVYSSRFFRDVYWPRAREGLAPDFVEWFEQGVLSGGTYE